MSHSDGIKTATLADLARIAMADLEGRPIDPAERAELLMLTGLGEADLLAVKRETLAERRHEQTTRELAALQASVDALGACLIQLVRTLERREEG